MKYLAILKDSLREAIDTKIFYVTVALSLLAILLIGSVSYRQVPAEEQVKHYVQLMNLFQDFLTHGKGNGLRFEVADFQQTNDAREPWQGDYKFTLAIKFPPDKDVKEIEESGLKRDLPTQIQGNLKRRLSWLDNVEVTTAVTNDPREVRYLVTSKGTTVQDRRGWTYEPRLFFGALPLSIFQSPLGQQIEFITDDLIGTYGAAITMVLSTIITAFFIPNMLRKGTVDLLLAKPLHRPTLLVYKYIGGLTFMFLNTLLIIVGIWLALGLQSHLWVNGLLLCIFIFTFQFAIFYAISTLMAVLTGSPIVSILTTVLAWVLLLGIGWGYRIIDAVRPEKIAAMRQEEGLPAEDAGLPKWVYVTADVIHFVTPHYKDLDVLTTKLIRSNLSDPDSPQMKDIDKRLGSINWDESLIVTICFIGIMLGLSCWRFTVRDY